MPASEISRAPGHTRLEPTGPGPTRGIVLASNRWFPHQDPSETCRLPVITFPTRQSVVGPAVSNCRMHSLRVSESVRIHIRRDFVNQDSSLERFQQSETVRIPSVVAIVWSGRCNSNTMKTERKARSAEHTRDPNPVYGSYYRCETVQGPSNSHRFLGINVSTRLYILIIRCRTLGETSVRITTDPPEGFGKTSVRYRPHRRLNRSGIGSYLRVWPPPVCDFERDGGSIHSNVAGSVTGAASCCLIRRPVSYRSAILDWCS